MKTSNHLSHTFLTLLLSVPALSVSAQQNPRTGADTVVVPLAETSQIIFTVGDPEDLETLQHYNFQALFDDVIGRLRESHGLASDTAQSFATEERQSRDEVIVEEEDWDEESDEEEEWEHDGRRRVGRTLHSYNIDLGLNNYLTGTDQFPDGSEPYAVRPWGSWYIAGNSVQRTRLAKHLFVEWGLGVSWYSFKFQEDNMLIQKDEPGVTFVADSRSVDFIKSKLSATFINASLVPVLDFADEGRKHRIWDGHRSGFRFGLGPYVGYRISSKTKLVYESDGDREKEKNRDNFYLNNLRYGLRMQIGVRSTDFFINYDMNELFAEGKGPQLNALSFGFIF